MIIDVGDHYLKWDNNKVDFDDLIEIYERSRWIPCSERLPKNHGPVIATISNGERSYVTMTYYCEEWLSGEWRIIAWQPLPEIYE